MAKTHSQRLNAIVRITRICSDICGADIFNENYRLNVRTVLVLTLICVSFAFLTYTMIDGYAAEGDWTILVQVFSLAGGTLLQGLCVFICFIVKQNKSRFLLCECFDIYETYERLDSDYRVHLNRGLKLLANLMKICAFINLMLVLGMSSMTFLYNFIFDASEMIVYGFIPGLDIETTHGLWLTNVIQTSFITVGGFGLYAADMATLTPISQITTFKGILQCKFREINQILDDDYESELKRRRDILDALKGILKFHQKYLIFLKVSRDVSYWSVIAKMATCFVAIVCALFCLLLGTWPAGYIYLAYCFVMMQVFCATGTMVEKTNEEFIQSCYNDVRWYELSVKEKKMLCIMLMMAQNTKGLTIGSVMQLSMNTGLQITKTIYSLTMLLMTFVE
ncbi:odorant receptor 67d-like isoform X2 [Musca autumnalis]|uniref:odorant receptor 67d-like isoform X2 n=1 Tax=Musca autumnalis TaxID=221902 RepID=UPI003CF0FD15